MAISEKEFRQMQKDIREIKRRLAREDAKRQTTTRKRKPAAPRSRRETPSVNEQITELLRSKGMLAELTPEEKARAERWRALPEEEKKRVWDEYFNQKLDKPLSDIIIENRR